MNYRTPLPLNIPDEYSHLFIQKQEYQLPELRIRQIQNVFVSHWGLVIKNGILVPKSAENLSGKYDQTFYGSHWRKGVEQYLVSKFGKSLPSIMLNDNELYFTIHTPWFGYFSWFTTCIPRLLTVIEKYPDAILIVPEEWGKIAYANDILNLFPSLKTKVLPADHHVFVKNYILAEVRPWTSVLYPEHINKTREFCFSALKNRINTTTKPIRKLYVSRKKANRRKVVNEQEIESYLQEQGFESICFEDYNVFDQICLAQNADTLISMHGAGLTNCMFMKPNSSLLELTPIVDSPEQFRLPFWRMTSILDINYYILFCKTINNGETDIYSRNIEIDLDALKNLYSKTITTNNS